MALIKCPECGKEISDKATSCPNCGCPINAETLKSNTIQDQKEKEKAEEPYRQMARERKKPLSRKSKIVMIATPICVVAVCLGAFFGTAKIRAYNSAQKLFTAKKYSEAESEFASLEGYKDSADWVQKSEYELAKQDLKNKKYEDAIKKFSNLQKYEDSQDLLNESKYQLAKSYFDSKDYKKAYDLFSALSGYEDSTDQADQANHMIDVQNDKTAPVISIPDGQNHIDCYTGDDITKETIAKSIGATATDDVSGDCEVSYDLSDINIKSEGDYAIKISSKDEAGNEAESQATITISSRGVGVPVTTHTDFGDLEVTLDGAHWSNWVAQDPETFADEAPEGTEIILVEMTVKNINYQDVYNGDLLWLDQAGIAITDDKGINLTEASSSYDDGLYEYVPDLPVGQTARLFSPVFATQDTTEITVVLPNGATMRTAVES